MSINKIKRALWAMNELISAGQTGITREELNRKWSNSRFNDKKTDEIYERTFFRMRRDLEQLFEVEIICREIGGVKYYSVDQTDYSVFLGLLCGMVSDNSKRNLSLKDLLEQVMNEVEISEEEKRMIDEISFKIGREAYECGQWLIDEARNLQIKGADRGQWAEHRLYHLCIWLQETYEHLQSWVGVYINRKASDGRGEVRFYIVCESQDTDLHSRLKEELALLPGEKREGDYWWFAPQDDDLHRMDFVSLPDRHAIRARIETMLARLNALQSEGQ